MAAGVFKTNLPSEKEWGLVRQIEINTGPECNSGVSKKEKLLAFCSLSHQLGTIDFGLCLNDLGLCQTFGLSSRGEGFL